MKFPKEALVEFIMERRDCIENKLRFVEAGEWVDEGKYQYRSFVFEHGGKFYEVTEGRSGSYLSDYYYESSDWDDEVDCDEVERVEVVKHEWRRVTNT